MKNNDILIKLNDASIFRSNKVILQDINLLVRRGDFIYLTGKTGSGKSSLLETLYADAPLKKGTGEVVGFDLKKIKDKSIPKLRRKLGIIFQKLQLINNKNVRDNLVYVMQATGWREKQKINRRLEEVLSYVNMLDQSEKMPYELSGGEQQRVSIARALINDPSLILADEPTRNLDPETSNEIMILLNRLCLKKRAVVMICHDKYLINQFPSKILHCNNKIISELSLSNYK